MIRNKSIDTYVNNPIIFYGNFDTHTHTHTHTHTSIYIWLFIGCYMHLKNVGTKTDWNSVIVLSKVTKIKSPKFHKKKNENLRIYTKNSILICLNNFSFLPRILIGIAMKYTRVNFIHIYITMASLFGLTMALMNLAESYLLLLVCCILWALWMGCPAGLYSIGIMELVGPEKHSSGQSIVESSYGLTTAFFGFLAGKIGFCF